MSSVRINKLLSQTGVASRRMADELMRQGRVSVNGTTVTELGTKADPDRDDVRVDGRRVKLKQERRYLLLDASLSDMTTGFKSLLLKVAQPFFRRPGGGTKVPIRVAGTPNAPQFGLDVKRALTPGD